MSEQKTRSSLQPRESGFCSTDQQKKIYQVLAVQSLRADTAKAAPDTLLEPPLFRKQKSSEILSNLEASDFCVCQRLVREAGLEPTRLISVRT
jgi:hypothetical protein